MTFVLITALSDIKEFWTGLSPSIRFLIEYRIVPVITIYSIGFFVATIIANKLYPKNKKVH